MGRLKGVKPASAVTEHGLRGEHLGGPLDPSSTNKPNRRQATDRGHPLAVYDGATLVGTMVEAGGGYSVFDVGGTLVGTFPDIRRAARACPTKDSQMIASL